MLDNNIKEAIQKAVELEKQPPELANKIIAWMENLVDGNEDITTTTSYMQRCSLCFETTNVQKKTGE